MNNTVSVSQHQVKQSQFGFTLIELIIVIVILGILAVVALPKFVDLQKDATISALQGAKAALVSANNQIYSKAFIQGQHRVNSTIANIDLDGDNTSDVIGYFGLIKFVISAREYAGLNSDLTLSKHYGGSASGLPWFIIYFTDNPPAAGNDCHIEVYYPTEAGGVITYTLKDDDC